MSQGGKSWCSYQRDQVTGLNTNIPTKAPLPDATLDVVKPAFTRLASVPFLEQCKIAAIKTPMNLSIVLWLLSPKETFNSPIELPWQ